jgi:hypothetical protein
MDERETISGEMPGAALPSRDEDGSSRSITTPAGRSRRRWYQFTVRAILALIVLAAVLLTAWRARYAQ